MSITYLISAGIIAMILIMPVFLLIVVGIHQIITSKQKEKYNIL